MHKEFTFKATESDAKKRLDIFLHEKLPETTRSSLKHTISEGLVSVDGTTIRKAGHRLQDGDEVEITLPEIETHELKAEAIPLDILFEDDYLLVINKPSGLSVHPGAGQFDGTLANALLHHSDRLSTIGGELRPGIVHRLDKETTGVMVIAKTDEAHVELAKQFKAHTIRRRYHAIVWGVMKDDSGEIDLPIGRSVRDRKKISTDAKKTREAKTLYKALKRFDGFSLLELTPHTGRTHQIRVHLAAINHPVVGDKLYGKRKVPSTIPKPVADKIKGIKSQCLHAISLGFTHPVSKEEMDFEAPYPPDIEGLIEEFESR
ncbi:MAG: RluA family pseudouridine synthase [Proteobacteria bacterium]|nr:RluA family pseudouridine synthase [Pseudomonadota bacterium]